MIKLVTSEAVAPDEVVMHGPRNSVRWTPGGGVEDLSEYQRSQIAKAIEREGRHPAGDIDRSRF